MSVGRKTNFWLHEIDIRLLACWRKLKDGWSHALSKFGIEISRKHFYKFWFETLFLIETFTNMVMVWNVELISDSSKVDRNLWGLLK